MTGPKSEGELHGDLPPALVESRIALLLEKKNPSQEGVWQGQVYEHSQAARQRRFAETE